jgi:hypothetical protein
LTVTGSRASIGAGALLAVPGVPCHHLPPVSASARPGQVVDVDRRQAVDPAQRQADLTSDAAGRPVPLGCW